MDGQTPMSTSRLHRLVGRLSGIRGRGVEPVPVPAPAAPPAAVVPEPPVAVRRDPGIDLAVATSVLAVASRLTSAELRRRLFEAVTGLPDVTVVLPKAGEAFDLDLHSWEASIEAPAPGLAGTVAETRSAGLRDHLGSVRRRAGVVVYESEGNLP